MPTSARQKSSPIFALQLTNVTVYSQMWHDDRRWARCEFKSKACLISFAIAGLTLAQPYIPNEANKVKRFPYYYFGDLLEPEAGVTEREIQPDFEFRPPTTFTDFLAQSTQPAREVASSSAASGHQASFYFPFQIPAEYLSSGQLGPSVARHSRHTNIPSSSSQSLSSKIIGSPDDLSRDLSRTIELVHDAKRLKGHSSDHMEDHHGHVPIPVYKLKDVVPHKKIIQPNRRIYRMSFDEPPLLTFQLEKVQTLLSESDLPPGNYESKQIGNNDRARICRFWNENGNLIMTIRIFDFHQNTVKMLMLRRSMSSLMQWIHISHQAFLNKLEIKNDQRGAYELKFWDWFFSETFTPTNGLPALGKVTEGQATSYDPKNPFGTLQEHLIDYLSQDAPSDCALTKAIIILGIWYKNFNPETWNGLDDSSYTSWIEVAVNRFLSERRKKKAHKPCDTLS
ncbi:uncharacterized protein PGTG_20726 [Puccinia graminis f. sp. tritici CRL 75-36-700-3]|uniref:Uncharacterized protein n=1 Tax=Puccinia graminis f. sp. tritici (strain CRL 75-36-700-3 / race SCCL) TaxID=418459 RepID=H6QP27_PUCGT|nr:uncharacterized protein PGTG_20726 [Puccinia graminis f. sp. tritici CRL 75-36-700-3]EHS63141.1 hypothetical protein PGTG_20726 [Puccinia graminis f. sp. tritici CRL 75-36-700-3]